MNGFIIAAIVLGIICIMLFIAFLHTSDPALAGWFILTMAITMVLIFTGILKNSNKKEARQDAEVKHLLEVDLPGLKVVSVHEDGGSVKYYGGSTQAPVLCEVIVKITRGAPIVQPALPATALSAACEGALLAASSRS